MRLEIGVDKLNIAQWNIGKTFALKKKKLNENYIKCTIKTK